MPRSVITGAKQHRLFQARGVTRLLDLLDVHPLFNVPSCVVIRQAGELHTDDVPTKSFLARLPAHEISLFKATLHLTHKVSATRFVGEVTVTSPYYDQFKSGANIYPRNLCFVHPRQELKPGDAAVNPAMKTDPDADREAKKPWKGVHLDGLIDPHYLYATLLSKNLIPFGYRRLHLVALPLSIEPNGQLKMLDKQGLLNIGDIRTWQTWFEKAEQKWNELKKDTTQETLTEWLNYHNKLTEQKPREGYKVLYTASGVHLAACVINANGTPPKVHEYSSKGFIVDVKTYYFDAKSAQEAHYLCAILNAPCVDEKIKAYQSRGKGTVGERDIHRTPFEACAIPTFDPTNPDHCQLAQLSEKAHEIIANTAFTGGVVAARRTARAAAVEQIEAIDQIAKKILGL